MPARGLIISSPTHFSGLWRSVSLPWQHPHSARPAGADGHRQAAYDGAGYTGAAHIVVVHIAVVPVAHTAAVPELADIVHASRVVLQPAPLVDNSDISGSTSADIRLQKQPGCRSLCKRAEPCGPVRGLTLSMNNNIGIFKDFLGTLFIVKNRPFFYILIFKF